MKFVTGGTRFGITSARANCLAVCGRTAYNASPARKCKCQSSGRRIVIDCATAPDCIGLDIRLLLFEVDVLGCDVFKHSGATYKVRGADLHEMCACEYHVANVESVLHSANTDHSNVSHHETI